MQSLPTEILLLIAEFADRPTLIALSQTCHHLHAAFSERLLDEVMIRLDSQNISEIVEYLSNPNISRRIQCVTFTTSPGLGNANPQGDLGPHILQQIKRLLEIIRDRVHGLTFRCFHVNEARQRDRAFQIFKQVLNPSIKTIRLVTDDVTDTSRLCSKSRDEGRDRDQSTQDVRNFEFIFENSSKESPSISRREVCELAADDWMTYNELLVRSKDSYVKFCAPSKKYHCGLEHCCGTLSHFPFGGLVSLILEGLCIEGSFTFFEELPYLQRLHILRCCICGLHNEWGFIVMVPDEDDPILRELRLRCLHYRDCDNQFIDFDLREDDIQYFREIEERCIEQGVDYEIDPSLFGAEKCTDPFHSNLRESS